MNQAMAEVLETPVVQTLNWPVAHARQALCLHVQDTPFYVNDFVGESPWTIGEGIYRGWGPAQLELCTNFTQTARGLERDHKSLELQTAVIIPKSRLYFGPDVPRGVMQAGGYNWQSGRQQALLESLQHRSEGSYCAEKITALDNVFFSQILIRVSDISSEVSTLACNLLTLATPTILRFLKEIHRVRAGNIHLARRGFGNSHRMPSSWWFPSSHAYKSHFEDLPLLIRKEEAGWVSNIDYRATNPDNLTNWQWASGQSFGDAVSETTTWLLARKRCLTGRTGVIEYSGLPSMDYRLLIKMTEAILEWLEESLEAVRGQNFESGQQAVDSKLIPKFRGIPTVASLAEWEYVMGRPK